MKKILSLLFFLFNFQSIFAEEATPPVETKKILLTGGASFIGSNFLQYLFDKYPDYAFIVLDNLTCGVSLDHIPEYIKESPRFQFVNDTLTDSTIVEKLMGETQWVVHFAACDFNDPRFLQTTFFGTYTLMEALVKHVETIERFIHVSSAEVYGTAEEYPMNEEHPLKPRTPCAASKLASEGLVFSYYTSFHLPVTIVRLFNTYGKGQTGEKMIPSFIHHAIQRHPLTIHGNGEQTRDWIHVHDACVALDRMLHLPEFSKIKGEIINIGSEVGISVLDVAKDILNYFNMPEEYLTFIPDRSGQIKSHIASTEKARSLLSWSPTINFEEGLKTTVEWYLHNSAAWVKED